MSWGLSFYRYCSTGSCHFLQNILCIVRRNSVLVISPMGVKALTPMSDQDRISPYNINTLSRPIYLLKHITYLRIRNWSCTKLPARILRIVKSYQGKQTLQITTSWNTLFLKVRFKFYQIHNVEFCKEKRKENPSTAVVLWYNYVSNVILYLFLMYKSSFHYIFDFKLVLAHDIDKLSDDVATYIEHLVHRYVDIFFLFLEEE